MIDATTASIRRIRLSCHEVVCYAINGAGKQLWRQKFPDGSPCLFGANNMVFGAHDIQRRQSIDVGHRLRSSGIQQDLDR